MREMAGEAGDEEREECYPSNGLAPTPTAMLSAVIALVNFGIAFMHGKSPSLAICSCGRIIFRVVPPHGEIPTKSILPRTPAETNSSRRTARVPAHERKHHITIQSESMNLRRTPALSRSLGFGSPLIATDDRESCYIRKNIDHHQINSAHTRTIGIRSHNAKSQHSCCENHI